MRQKLILLRITLLAAFCIEIIRFCDYEGVG
jgi:hypothetical protein